MIRFTRRAFAAGLLLASVAAAQAQIEPQRQQHFPPVEAVVARHGMVVTQEAKASRIGADILKRGGNAVDAAVAIGFTMAVTYPRAGNIGGGGFIPARMPRCFLEIPIYAVTTAYYDSDNEGQVTEEVKKVQWLDPVPDA